MENYWQIVKQLILINYRDYFRNNSCDFSKKIKNTKKRYHILSISFVLFYCCSINDLYRTPFALRTDGPQTRLDLDLGYTNTIVDLWNNIFVWFWFLHGGGDRLSRLALSYVHLLLQFLLLRFFWTDSLRKKEWLLRFSHVTHPLLLTTHSLKNEKFKNTFTQEREGAWMFLREGCLIELVFEEILVSVQMTAAVSLMMTGCLHI